MEFKNIHYSEHDKYFEAIQHESEKLESQLKYIGFEYANKISGKLGNEELNDISRSISLRLTSIFFHYELLASINVHNKPEKYADSGFPSPGLLVANRQDFLFDSIIFNMVSLFDYVGSLISHIILKKKNQLKAITNYMRKKENLKKEGLGMMVIKTHDYLFSKLNDYRSDLIHYSDDSTHFGENIDYFHNTIRFEIYAPFDFRKKFKKEFKSLSEKPDINSACLWLIHYTLIEIQGIFEQLRIYMDIHRLIPVEKEIIFFKKPPR